MSIQEDASADKGTKRKVSEQWCPMLSQLSAENIRFLLLAVALITSFGVHNYIQEMLTTIPNFTGGALIGYLDVLGLTLCTFIEAVVTNKSMSRKAPMTHYVALSLCLLVSSVCASVALDFINYPTKVAIRSCKLIPTMFIATLINKKKVPASDYLFAVLISLGLVSFSVADFQSYPNMNPAGLLLTTISVFADAFLPNFQESIFTLGATRVEVSLYSNVLSLIILTAAMLLNGSLLEAFGFVFSSFNVLAVIMLYTFLSYGAITIHMVMVKEFGGINTVLVGNTRKACTIILSFILFPKPNSYLYAVGLILVFGGLIGSAYSKEKKGRVTLDAAAVDTNNSISFESKVKHSISSPALLLPATSNFKS